MSLNVIIEKKITFVVLSLNTDKRHVCVYLDEEGRDQRMEFGRKGPTGKKEVFIHSLMNLPD